MRSRSQRGHVPTAPLLQSPPRRILQRRSSSLFRAVALLVFGAVVSCEGPVSPPDLPPAAKSFSSVVSELPVTCGAATTVDLVADETVRAGTVRMSNDGEHLYVVYETSSEWPIAKTALFVGEDPGEIPTGGRGGNPQIGRFPYSERHPLGTTEVVWKVELADVDGSTAVVAAFAEVGENQEGAWADGEPITSGGSWATYATHAIAECDVGVSQTIGASGGTIEFQNLLLDVPQGALEEDVEITVTPISTSEIQSTDLSAAAATAETTATADLSIDDTFLLEGTAFHLGPDDLQFQEDVTVTIGYDEEDIPDGISEDLLRIFIVNAFFSDPGPNSELVDEVANTVTTFTDHFSDFVVGGPAATADLEMAMTAEPDPVEVGEDLVHTLTVTNHGPDDVTDVLVGLVVDGDVDIKSPNQEGCTDLFQEDPPRKLMVDCPAGDLASGESAELTLVVVPNEEGVTLTSTARIDDFSGAEDPDASNNEAVEETSVVAAATADLEMAMTAEPDPVEVGEDLVHTLTVTNHGPDDVTGVLVGLVVDGDVDIKSPNQEGCTDLFQEDPPQKLMVNCPAGDLASGASAELTLVVVPNEEGATLTSTARIDDFSGAEDPDASNNEAVEETTVDAAAPAATADLEMAMTAEPDPVEVGEDLVHTLTVTNHGPDDVTGVLVGLVVDGDVDIKSPNQEGCTDLFQEDPPQKLMVNCPAGDLASGASAELTLVVVPNEEGATLTSTARIDDFSGAEDPDASNNEAVEETTVDAAAGPTGTIVFASNSANFSLPQLYTRDLSTSDATMINHFSNWSDPQWSPDGTRIVAKRGASIRTMTATGADEEEILLPEDLLRQGHPSWSPDASKVVFQAVKELDPEGDFDIYVVDLGTLEVTQLTDNAFHDEAPDWSPDGSKIVYSRDGNELRTISPDGTNDVALLTGVGPVAHPDWSPDGSKVAFSASQTTGSAIQVISVSDPSIITTLEHDGRLNVKPAWSPDGGHIAFSKSEELMDDDFMLWMIASDGLSASVLLEGAEDDAVTDLDVDWK